MMQESVIYEFIYIYWILDGCYWPCFDYSETISSRQTHAPYIYNSEFSTLCEYLIAMRMRRRFKPVFDSSKLEKHKRSY